MKFTNVTTGLVIITVLNLASCARTNNQQMEVLGAAKMAVRDAEREDNTTKFAPSELAQARSKLADAELANTNGDQIRARRMSEQAIVDAQLARAKTTAAVSHLGAAEEKDAMHDVQREIQRNQ